MATSRLKVDDIKSGIDIDYIKSLNYLVCTGLSNDDRGLIAYFRELNPGLKIVANSLPNQVPEFILPDDPNDLYLPGDTQEIMPELAKLVQERLKP